MEYTIGEIAERAGLATSAIRYYEKVKLLPAPTRVNGRRRYDDAVLQRLGLIQLARQLGFHISELQVLFGDFALETSASERWHSLASQKVGELEALIEQTQAVKTWLLESMGACDCVAVGECATVTFDETGRAQVARRQD